MGLVRKNFANLISVPPLSVLARAKKPPLSRIPTITRRHQNALILPPILETLAAAVAEKEEHHLVNMDRLPPPADRGGT
jgi:hypothetical protein